MRTLLAAGAAAAVLGASGAGAQAAVAPKDKAPAPFGTSFQPDPGHDFTRGIHSRHDGVLRGWITYVGDGVAEYEPVKWQKGTRAEGRFVGLPEGDSMAYASPIAGHVAFLSAYGCGTSPSGMTVGRKTGLGDRKCSRSVLIKRHAGHRMPSLITVRKGHITRVQEIWTP
ncbi:hypothetical protein ABGB18_18910 [Nonomuraea sp. B12E4]|uniref:hypothetical protein n=1 Tax=Nonomuraea sp. B12E4 TaxID=3153564 RepID=UPI00325EF9FB